MIKVVIADFDDWQGIYINGKLAYENHSLYYKDVLKALNQPYKQIQVDMMELDIGRLPETVEELEKLVGENE